MSMGTEITRRQQPDIEQTFRIAKGFAMSGYFADAKSAEAAFVKVMAGAEMGLSPFQAMTGIHIIEGKPVVGAGLLASLLDQHPEYDYTVEWEPDEKDPVACTVAILKGGVVRGRSRFSLEDAKKAGLDKPTRNGKPSNYLTFGRNMLYARAMSNAVRWYAPGVTGTAVYTDEGEIDDEPVLPPHIQALDAGAAIDVTPSVTGYVAPDDPMTDVPFEDAAPAASSDSAESPDATGQPAAEPAGDASPGGLILIDTLEDAQRLINALDGPQLGVMKRMLSIDTKTTRRLMADALLEQRNGWDAQDILAELAGWA